MHANHKVFDEFWEVSYTETPFRRDIPTNRVQNAVNPSGNAVKQARPSVNGLTDAPGPTNQIICQKPRLLR